MLTSSRIFRTQDYASKGVLPIDYLVYYYHLSKGPIYYYDKIMATYLIGENNTFANNSNVKDLNGMFAYKLSLLFDFTQDEFCTQMQKKYDVSNGAGEGRYKRLLFFKKVFGIRLGWKLWFIYSFVFKYGVACMNINYVYSQKKAKQRSDSRQYFEINYFARCVSRNKRHISFWNAVLFFDAFYSKKIKNNIEKKQEKRILRNNNQMQYLKKLLGEKND